MDFLLDSQSVRLWLEAFAQDCSLSQDIPRFSLLTVHQSGSFLLSLVWRWWWHICEKSSGVEEGWWCGERLLPSLLEINKILNSCHWYATAWHRVAVCNLSESAWTDFEPWLSGRWFNVSVMARVVPAVPPCWCTSKVHAVHYNGVINPAIGPGLHLQCLSYSCKLAVHCHLFCSLAKFQRTGTFSPVPPVRTLLMCLRVNGGILWLVFNLISQDIREIYVWKYKQDNFYGK